MKISKADILKNQSVEQRDIYLAKGEQDHREMLSEQAKKDLEKNPEKLKEFKMQGYDGNTDNLDLEEVLNNRENITFFGVSTTGLLGQNGKGRDYVYTDANGVAHKIENRMDEPFLFVAKTFTYNEENHKYELSNFMYLPMEVSNKELITACLCDAEKGKYDVFSSSAINKNAYISGINVESHNKAISLINDYFANNKGVNISYTDFHASMLRNVGVKITTDIDMEKVVGLMNMEHQFLFDNKNRTTLKVVSEELLKKEPTDTIDKLDCQIGILEWLAQNEMQLDRPIATKLIDNVTLEINEAENMIDISKMKSAGFIASTYGMVGVVAKTDIPVQEANAENNVHYGVSEEFARNFGFDMSFNEKTTKFSEEVAKMYEQYEEADYDDYDYDEYDADFVEYDEYDEEYEFPETEAIGKMTDIDKIDIHGMDKVNTSKDENANSKETTKTVEVMVNSPDYTKQFEGLIATLQSGLEESHKRNQILEEKLAETNKTLEKLTALVDSFVKVYSVREVEKSNNDKGKNELQGLSDDLSNVEVNLDETV